MNPHPTVQFRDALPIMIDIDIIIIHGDTTPLARHDLACCPDKDVGLDRRDPARTE